MTTKEQLEARIREEDLLTRLEKCQTMIGKMCSEGRPPKMSIPILPTDEDVYICTTLRDAMHYYKTVEGALLVSQSRAEGSGCFFIPITKEGVCGSIDES